MSNDNKEMREIIELIEVYTSEYSNIAPVIEEFQELKQPVLEELRESIFKLRSHMENEDSDHSLGVEEGMQRAADMIENLIRRHEGN